MLNPLFQVTINGQDIRHYPLPRASKTIRYSLEYEEQQARIYYGLTPDQYDQLPGCPWWCDDEHPMSKSHVIAMWRLHRLTIAVEEHVRHGKKGHQ